jgi:methyl-accepting chemotaxis protein
MTFLDHLGLRPKLILPLLAMAVIFGTVLAAGIVQYLHLAATTGQIITQLDPALGLLQQEELNVQGLGYDVYRILSYQTGTAAENNAVAMFQVTAAEGTKDFDDAARLDPSHATQINVFKARFSTIETALEVQNQTAVTTNGFTLGASDTTADLNVSAGVARNLVSIDSQIDGFAHDLNAFVRGVQAQDVQAAQALQARTMRTVRGMVVSGVLGLLAGAGGFLWIVSAGVVGPLNGLSRSMVRLAENDLAIEIGGSARRDEVGGMARALTVFKQNAVRARALEAAEAASRTQAEALRAAQESERARIAAAQNVVVEQFALGLKNLAAGRLGSRITTVFDPDYEGLRQNFNTAMARLQEAMTSVNANAQTVKTGAGELIQASDELARRTEQQAASLEETAAALEEISKAVGKTAQGAHEARQAAGDAAQEAVHAKSVMAETITAMNGIEQASREIGTIIGVIDQIAFQTNLLALNAGVEAARAGDAGRGFAVVAMEVRALAQRAADAAKQIKTLIGNASTQVEGGVSLVTETGQALERIAAQVDGLSGLVTSIAGSAQEQAAGLVQVNTAISAMDRITQQNAAMVEQATAGSHALANEAASLAKLVGKFETAAAPQRRLMAV